MHVTLVCVCVCKRGTGCSGQLLSLLFSESVAVDSSCCHSDPSTLPPFLTSSPHLSLPSQVSLRHKSKKKTRGGECVSLRPVGCNLDPVWVCE